MVSGVRLPVESKFSSPLFEEGAEKARYSCDPPAKCCFLLKATRKKAVAASNAPHASQIRSSHSIKVKMASHITDSARNHPRVSFIGLNTQFEFQP